MVYIYFIAKPVLCQRFSGTNGNCAKAMHSRLEKKSARTLDNRQDEKTAKRGDFFGFKKRVIFVKFARRFFSENLRGFSPSTAETAF